MIMLVSSSLNVGLDEAESVGDVLGPDQHLRQQQDSLSGDLLVDGRDKGDVCQSKCGDVGDSVS